MYVCMYVCMYVIGTHYKQHNIASFLIEQYTLNYWELVISSPI